MRFLERTGGSGAKGGGVGVSGLGGVLPGIDTQFLHAGDESRAVDAHAGRSPVGSANTAIALSEGPHDLFVLLLGKLVGGPLSIQGGVDTFLHDTSYVFLHRLGGESRGRVGAWLAQLGNRRLQRRAPRQDRPAR